MSDMAAQLEEERAFYAIHEQEWATTHPGKQVEVHIPALTLGLLSADSQHPAGRAGS